MPSNGCVRLVEPFVGSGAVTLAAASQKRFSSYVIGDALEPLPRLWQAIVENPAPLAEQYETLWHRERERPIDAYYEIRSEFNEDQAPAKLLYLLARCVKNAVRFNPSGEFNQSPDKRRTGTLPKSMKAELFAAHGVLASKCHAVNADFMAFFLQAQEGDFFYLDPPYQGTSDGRDQRYISGVSRDRMIAGLSILNEKQIPFVLSYDGSCGERNYGKPLPDALAQRVLLDVGRSSQATLSGRDELTVESLYISHALSSNCGATTLSLRDFANRDQASLFA